MAYFFLFLHLFPGLAALGAPGAGTPASSEQPKLLGHDHFDSQCLVDRLGMYL